MKRKIIFIMLLISFIIVTSLGSIGLYYSIELDKNKTSENSSDTNDDNADNNNVNDNMNDEEKKDNIDNISNDYKYYESKEYINNAEVALKNGQVASKKLSYKAVIYNGYYYFYNNDKFVPWERFIDPELLEKIDGYALVLSDEEYNVPVILYSFNDNRFIGEPHTWISCGFASDERFYFCGVKKDVIPISEEMFHYGKMNLMSLKDGSVILDTKYNYISEDYNGNFIVSNDDVINIKSSTALLDSKGKELIKYDKQLILSLENGNYFVIKDDKVSLIDNSLNKLELKSINGDFSVKSSIDISNNYYHNLYKCNKNKMIDLDNFSYKCTSDSLILYLNEGTEMYCTSYDDCKDVINDDEVALLYSVNINTGKLKKLTADDFEFNAE